MSSVQRARSADDLVRKLASAIRSAQLYATGHPIVMRNIAALAESLAVIHATSATLAIGIVGEDLVVGEIPVPREGENMGELMRRFQQAGVERIAIPRGVESAELTQLIQTLAAADPDRVSALAALKHIRVGRLEVEKKVDAPAGDMATIKRLYDDAVTVAERLWKTAVAEGKPDPNACRGIVDSLAHGVAQNPTALLALTALQNYDNYTFTHMADVYDAMRSQRAYQQAFPTDRILAVLQRNDGKQFDQHLVRRFAQLVGIYPAGNLVRLKTGEIAVVIKAYAPDPHRPRIKVLRGRDGVDLERPYEINLWEATDEQATAIEKPLDPAEHGIDPLSHLQ